MAAGMPVRNPVKERLAEGSLVLCMAVRQARVVDIAMMAGACGFDAIYLDMEHGTIPLDTASQICVAALPLGLGALVRVPADQYHDATRLLDGGALGVLFPHVENAAQASEAVANCKFPPFGHRSVAGVGPLHGYSSRPAGGAVHDDNDSVLCIMMLETAGAVANADSIAAVDGVDMLLIGSNDLSTALGVPGKFDHPSMRAAFERVAAACRRHGKHLGIGGIYGRPEMARSLVIDLGARFLIAGMDAAYLMQAATSDVQMLRGIGEGIAGNGAAPSRLDTWNKEPTT
jgi:2-keto-3-deoxy-L-rhamnonate aldolase RhmA